MIGDFRRPHIPYFSRLTHLGIPVRCLKAQLFSRSFYSEIGPTTRDIYGKAPTDSTTTNVLYCTALHRTPNRSALPQILLEMWTMSLVSTRSSAQTCGTSSHPCPMSPPYTPSDLSRVAFDITTNLNEAKPFLTQTRLLIVASHQSQQASAQLQQELVLVVCATGVNSKIMLGLTPPSALLGGTYSRQLWAQ